MAAPKAARRGAMPLLAAEDCRLRCPAVFGFGGHREPLGQSVLKTDSVASVSYTHLRAHETSAHL
eukprot:15153039-Alexandrium_andersonii.AAC.1